MNQEDQKFIINHNSFEGPLPLLLSLIEKRKFSITDISLSKITDEYLSFLNSNPFTISENSEFIDIASTLLLIKSKALLPQLELTTKEESDIQELQDRLMVYQKLKDASGNIRPLTFGQSLFRNNPKNSDIIIFSPDKSITTIGVFDALKTLLKSLPEIKKSVKVKMKETVSIGHMINTILTRVKNSIKTSFSSCTAGLKEKQDVVVTFLALLELVKEQEVRVSQTERYGTIDIESNTLTTPQIN